MLNTLNEKLGEMLLSKQSAQSDSFVKTMVRAVLEQPCGITAQTVASHFGVLFSLLYFLPSYRLMAWARQRRLAEFLGL